MSTTVHYATGNHRRPAAAESTFLPRISIFMRQRKVWPPALLAGLLWRGLTHLGTHRKVLRFLLKLPPLAEFVFSNPTFAIKYLAPRYLARDLTVPERASCFLYHYRRLYAALPDQLLRRTLKEDLTLHEMPEGANLFALTMGLSRPYGEEGELSLHLCVNGEIAFILSFTIVPGSVAQSQAGEILLITRLQGIKGAYPQISAATKALHDVAPAALLFAALKGVADAFGIGEIAAVSAARQSSYHRDYAAFFQEAYDDFFAQVGMSIGATGFYRSSIPLQGKPLAFIKRGHKLRTKEKRAFKQEIRSACAGFFQELAPAASHKLPL
jgi:hypothetical protein